MDYSQFTDFTPGPVNAESDSSDMGGGYGSWYDWSQPGLGDVSSFYTPAVQNGDASTDAQINEQGLRNWFKTTGNRLKSYNVGDTTYSNVFGPQGNPLSKTLSFNGNDDFNRTWFTLANMAIGGAGGATAGAGGIGADAATAMGQSGNTALASGINGGLNGLVTTGSPKAAVSGGLGAGFFPDVAGNLGIENQYLADGVNGALRNGTLAAINGGDVKSSAAQGGLQGLASYAADQMTTPDSYVATNPGRGFYNELKQQSTIPGSTQAADIGLGSGGGQTSTQYVPSSSPAAYTNASSEKSALSFESPALQQFFDKIIPQNAGQWGDLAQGLMGMYVGNRQRKNATRMMKNIGSNREAYGQQLQGALQRRDAASGRRSDFGGRQVELQAKLAELDSRNAPALAAMQNNELGGWASMLQSGLRYGGKAGWFGDKYNPNVQQSPVTSTMLPSTWTSPQPTNMDLNYDPTLGRSRYKLGGE